MMVHWFFMTVVAASYTARLRRGTWLELRVSYPSCPGHASDVRLARAHHGTVDVCSLGMLYRAGRIACIHCSASCDMRKHAEACTLAGLPFFALVKLDYERLNCRKQPSAGLIVCSKLKLDKNKVMDDALLPLL